MVELIITEKPAQAEKIAIALADDAPVKKALNKVNYYEVKHNGNDILVGCAVGHLYGLKEVKKKKGWTYPVFDVEWTEAYALKKTSAFSKPYLKTLQSLAKKADSFTVACDYDTEGSVIGYNCVRFLAKKKDARRMKFSTLTKDELRESYANASAHLDFEIIEAGETRHYLDYFWGISLSRALTLAIKSTGAFKLVTAGRVQGPALKIIVEREKEISAFKPDPYWEVHLEGEINKEKVTAQHKAGKIFDKAESKRIMEQTKGQDATITKISEREFSQAPPNPFNLTALQMEAYNNFNLTPKDTLSVAQDLYTAGYISYPRTSSQKLPAALGLKKIIEKLQQQKDYKELSKQLLDAGPIKPNEGNKSDPAHPAIYPTGEKGRMSEKQKKVYDLIVRRVLASCATEAKRKTVTAELDVNGEPFAAKGTTTVEKGWHEYYGPYVNLKEEELPQLEENQVMKKPSIEKLDKETQPPKRYTQASIIKELEKLNLGTKATRASIVDTLYQRHYVVERSITATALGIKTVETLETYCPRILDKELTRYFEEEMEKITEGKKHMDAVLEEAKKVLTKTLNGFREHENEVGKRLIAATRETEKEINFVAKCMVCKKGDLEIRNGRFGKFVACNQYPDCETTFSLPANAMLKTTKNLCKECNYPVVMAIRSGRRPFNYCINKMCPPKVAWREEQEKKKAEAEKEGKTTKKTTRKRARKKTAKKAAKKATKKAVKKT